MASVDVVTVKNEKAGSIDLNPAVFDARVRPHLYHAEVRRQLAERRAGTHATKNRAGVSGGGAKPYRQKGTGRARQGTTRAPQFAGGGVVFGPVPRGYGHKLTKKMRRAALNSALTQWLREGAMVVVDDLALDEYKTRRMVEMLGSLGLAGQKVLIVIEDANPTVEASVRNLPGVGLVRAAGLNVYDVLRHDKLLITKAAVSAVEARLLGEGRGATA
jgi:large subunit ribosomal protein L4